jgi:hypothetical protein
MYNNVGPVLEAKLFDIHFEKYMIILFI